MINEHLTEEEKVLVYNHPRAAQKVNVAKNKAGNYTDRIFGSGATNADGTVANAFKHAMWNALMTRYIGEELAEHFATAHEIASMDDVSPYKNATIADHCSMDLYFNRLGREVALSCPDITDEDELAEAVLGAVYTDNDGFIWVARTFELSHEWR